MNESFGGYNGYGSNENGTDRERDDLEPGDFSANDSPEYSTLDSYDEEEKEPYYTEDQISDSKEQLDAVKEELERKPGNEKLLQIKKQLESTLELLKEWLSEENSEFVDARTIKNVPATPVHRDEAPKHQEVFRNAEGMVPDSQGRLWPTLEDAIASDREGK